MFGKQKVLIVGTFRCGTNAMASVLENNYNCTPTFNKYFWKHGLPPSHSKGFIPSNLPVICMVRNPIQFNESLFRFWHTRRKELNPNKSISKYIREPCIVYDNSKGLDDIHYYFQHPTDYWNRFYYSWINWTKIQDQLMFIKLEDFEKNTESVLNSIENRFLLKRKKIWTPSLPKKRIGPHVPTHISFQEELDPADINFIKTQAMSELLKFFSFST